MIDAALYVGLPFKPKGRDADGLDCWGLVRLVLGEQFGVDLPLWLDYDTVTPCDATAAHLAACAQSFPGVPPDEAEAGDILLFRVGPHLAHVGVCLGGGRMLHIHEGVNAAIERYATPKWAPRLEGVYRVSGRHV